MVRSRPSAQATSDHLIKTKEFEKELSSMKKDTLGHVQLIKQMFQVEQQIRNQLDEESDGKAQAERQNRELNIENRELRERIEVLEYLTVGELADTISGGGQPQTGQKAAKFSQRVLDDVMTTACARIAGDIHPNKASELQVELDGVRQENKSLGQENKSLGAQLKQMNDKVEKLKQSQRAALPLTPQSPRDAARGKRTSSGAAKKFTPGRRRDRQKEMDSTSNSSDVRGTTKATRTKRNGGRNVSSKQPSSEAGSSGVLTVDELKRLLSGGSGSSGPSEKKHPMGKSRSSTTLGFHEKSTMEFRESQSSDGTSAGAAVPPPSAFITRLSTTGKLLSHTNWATNQPNQEDPPPDTSFVFQKVATSTGVPNDTAQHETMAELDKLIRARSELKRRSLFSAPSPRSPRQGEKAVSPRS